MTILGWMAGWLSNITEGANFSPCDKVFSTLAGGLRVPSRPGVT